MNVINIRRGDIFYAENLTCSQGSEQQGARPVIVVSNDIGNNHSNIVEIVPLTTAEKNEQPTHVKINSAKHPSTALCEQIKTYSKERLTEWYGCVTEQEQKEIDKALAISIGLDISHEETPQKNDVDIADQIEGVKIIAERDIYKSLYENLLEKVMKGA